MALKKSLRSCSSSILRAIGSVIDGDDAKVIAVVLVAVAVLGLALVLLAGAAGIALAVFEGARRI